MKKILLTISGFLLLFPGLAQAKDPINDPKYPEDVYGQYEVDGYYIKQQDDLYGENYYIGYFVLKAVDKPEFTDYIEYLIDNGNTVNSYAKSGEYKINLGCYDKDSVGTLWYEIEGDEYKKLKSSHKDKLVKLLINIDILPEVDGPCISHLNKVKVLDTPTEVPGTFADIPTLHPNSEAAEMLYKSGIVSGNPDGTFLPDNSINRAEITKLVVKMMVGDPAKNTYKNCFPDVSEEWFAPYVCYAKKMGWIKGYNDGNFKPANKTNRAEAIKIVLNAFYAGKVPKLSVVEESTAEMADDAVEDEWYYQMLKYSVAKNLLDFQHVIYNWKNNYTYSIGEEMNRKEVIEMIFRLMSLQ